MIYMYKFRYNLKKLFKNIFLIVIAVIVVCVLLCKFGILVPKGQISNSNAISVVKSELNNIASKEYTLDFEIISIEIDPNESERIINTYKESELAKKRRWSNEVLDDLIAIKTIYYTEYDHSKTFIDDGYTEQYFYLIKDDSSEDWEIMDIASPHITNIPK